MIFILELIFCASVLLVAYHFVAYPLLLRPLARRQERTAAEFRAPAGDVERFPTISVIVPVHNEASVIARKVENLGALSYPSGRLSLVLAFDGCSDNSKDIAVAAIERLGEPSGWRLAERRKNVGKIAVINAEIARIDSDLVVLTDASALVGADALLRAAHHFADPRVGVVCGTYRLLKAGQSGEAAYWSYQTRLKADEAALAAPMGAHGAFYAFRRSPWEPLPPETINDDFVLPLRIVARGYRAIYDPSIVATELEQSRVRQDFRRRMRIGAGNLQQVFQLATLADVRRGWIAFLFLSGKGLRAFVPLLLLLSFLAGAGLAIAGSPMFQWLVIMGIVAAALSIAMALAEIEPRPPLLASASYALLGVLAGAMGSMLFLTGQEERVWRLSTAAKSEPKTPT